MPEEELRAFIEIPEEMMIPYKAYGLCFFYSKNMFVTRHKNCWYFYKNDSSSYRHRETGPAVQHIQLCQRKHQYWIEGKRLSRKDFIKRYEMIYLKEYKGL